MRGFHHEKLHLVNVKCHSRQVLLVTVDADIFVHFTGIFSHTDLAREDTHSCVHAQYTHCTYVDNSKNHFWSAYRNSFLCVTSQSLKSCKLPMFMNLTERVAEMQTVCSPCSRLIVDCSRMVDLIAGCIICLIGKGCRL